MASYSSAIIETEHREKFLLQLRDYNPSNWPGCFALLGGKIKEGELPREAIFRELEEETNLYGIASGDELQPIKERSYYWPDDIRKVLENVLAAYPKIPGLTPKGGLDEVGLRGALGEGPDYYFVYRMPEEKLRGVKIKEGRMVGLYSPAECMALIIAANDRLALLDHFAESEIKFK